MTINLAVVSICNINFQRIRILYHNSAKCGLDYLLWFGQLNQLLNDFIFPVKPVAET